MSERKGEKMKKLGLALGSGGSRGIAHVGFLKALEEAGLRPDFISGCSMGAVVGAAYASGMPIDEIRDELGKLRARRLLSFTLKKGGLCSTRKMRKRFLKCVGDLQFSQLKIPFQCTATDLRSKRLITFSTGSVVDAVVASSTIPMLFKPLEREEMRLVDGGILERVPVPSLKQMGADVIVAVDVLGWRESREKCPSAFGVLMEMMDVVDDLRTREFQAREGCDFWLVPALGDLKQSDFKKGKFAYEKGYELGVSYAPKIKEALEE